MTFKQRVQNLHHPPESLHYDRPTDRLLDISLAKQKTYSIVSANRNIAGRRKDQIV